MITDPPEELARRMAADVAPGLAAAVHRRDRDVIANLLLPLDPQELRGLVVVLASQITIDDVAVRRAAAGERLPLTWPERAAAVALLAAQGHGASIIAKRLRLSGTTAQWLTEMFHEVSRGESVTSVQTIEAPETDRQVVA